MINLEPLDQREPDPDLMLKAYSQSAETLNLLRTMSSCHRFSQININDWKVDFDSSIYKISVGLLDSLNQSLNLLKGAELDEASNINSARIYTGHEGYY